MVGNLSRLLSPVRLIARRHGPALNSDRTRIVSLLGAGAWAKSIVAPKIDNLRFSSWLENHWSRLPKSGKHGAP